jgi:hypothetical protein
MNEINVFVNRTTMVVEDAKRLMTDLGQNARDLENNVRYFKI